MDASPEKIVDIPLPVPGMRQIGHPYTDVDGGLAVVMATPDGARAMLVRLPPGGAPSATQINPGVPLKKPWTVFWSRDGRLFLLWTDPDGRAVHGAVTLVAKPDNPLAGKRLFTGPQPVIDLRIYQRYDERKNAHDIMCAALCHNWVLDMFNLVRVNLMSGATESKEDFIADGMGYLNAIQSEMDADHQIAYLFREPEGKVWYGPTDLAKTAPIEIVPENPGISDAIFLHVDMSPTLVAAGRLSRSPGFYLRFVHPDGDRIEVRRV